MAPDELFETVAESLIGDPRIGEGRMMGARVLKVSGKVFAMLVRDKLVVKLPGERVESLIHSGRGEPFDPGHGRVMKEWVASAPGGEDEWLRLAEEARDFVASVQS